jgi:hypothetical protein
VLADLGTGDVDPAGAQVLPEQARGDLPAQLVGPPRGVLVGVGVHGGVHPAVMLAVALHVPGEAEALQRHPALDGALVDRGRERLFPRLDQDLVDDRDRRQRADGRPGVDHPGGLLGRHVPSVPPARQLGDATRTCS